jgi:endonuclease YncB( thermonuclease family)
MSVKKVTDLALVVFGAPRLGECWPTLVVGAGRLGHGAVVAISDGDTLTILTTDRVQHRVRLAGIDRWSHA